MIPKTVTLMMTAASVVIFGSHLASANVNFFPPISGAGAVSTNNSSDIVYNAGWGPGYVINASTVSNRSIDISLGHAQGGSNGFTFSGYNYGTTLSCTVWVISSTNGPTLGYNGSTTVYGYYSFFINTTPPSGDVFYSGECSLPPNASISGVYPNH